MTRLYAVLAGLAMIAALITGVFWKGHSTGYDSGVTHCAGLIAKLDGKGHDACSAAIANINAGYDAERRQFEADARAKELADAKANAETKVKYEKELHDAQDDADRTIADLRAGNLRLRKQWQCPAIASAGVSTPAAGGSVAAGSADDRDQSAGRIVRAAAEADAQIRALQRIVIEDRQ